MLCDFSEINKHYGENKMSIQKARIYFSGENLLLFTKYPGLDPEIGSGIDNNFYPRPRIFALGLNFEF